MVGNYIHVGMIDVIFPDSIIRFASENDDATMCMPRDLHVRSHPARLIRAEIGFAGKMSAKSRASHRRNERDANGVIFRNARISYDMVRTEPGRPARRLA